MADLREISDLERALHEIVRLEKEVRLVRDFLLAAVSRERPRAKSSPELIDPRTGRAFRRGRK